MREEWIEIELDKIAKVNPKKPQADDKLEVTFLPMPLVEEETGRYFLKETKKYSQVKKGYTGFIEGDILFAKITPCMENGKIAIINNLVNTIGFGSTEFHVLRPSQAINKKFLFHYLVQRAFRGYAQRKMTGSAGQLRVPKSVLESAKIPLGPLPEQRAIVAKIEQLFSELDHGIQNLKAAKDKLEIYRQAVLKKAFEGKFTTKWREEYNGQTAPELYQQTKEQREELFTQRIDEWILEAEQSELKGNKKPPKPKKPVIGAELNQEEKEEYSNTPDLWHLFHFIDLIKYEENGIKRGPFGSAIKKAFFVPKGHKVYEQQNAINDNSFLGTYYLDDRKYKELIKFSVKGGDYIVSCSGTIGRIHKLSKDCEPGVINQALLKIVLDEELMHSKYFLYLFRSEVFQRRILKGTRGTGMQNLASVDEIKELIIQLPPIEEQLQIIQEIELRLSVCDNILSNIEEGLEKSEALRQSILKQAFEGKLLKEEELEACRKEPDWEPAEKLLERIKNETTMNTKLISYAG